ncbi:hypothetical protein FRC12_021146 [Ceratobasidium sp. 428]|nr:hypothetical protein FRC12_021146 [Ceratobasidium sp. 428]
MVHFGAFQSFVYECVLKWLNNQVFVESLTQPGLSGMCKYGELHGHLRTALDKLNDLHSHVCGTEQTGKNEKALPGYFYLNK